jgi:hypothetical protein
VKAEIRWSSSDDDDDDDDDDDEKHLDLVGIETGRSEK